MRKKIEKLLCFAFLCLFACLTNVLAAETAPNKIEMQGQTHHFKQWGDVREFYYKSAKIDGKKDKIVYCTNYNYRVPTEGKKLQKLEALDAGFAYIIANGYPNKKWFGSEYKNYYTTQLAIWYYNDGRTDIDFSKYEVASSASVKANDTWDLDTMNKIQKYAKELSNGAKAAKKQGFSKPSIKIGNAITFTLSSDSKYYVSNQISVNAVSVPGKYSVQLTGAPKGAIIADASGKETGDLKTSAKFMIKIPADKVTEKTKITIQVSATGEVGKAYNYKYNNNSQKWQNIMPGYLYPVTSSVSGKKTATLNPNKYTIRIVKKDTATGKGVSGATIVVKNAKGTQVGTCTSSATGICQVTNLLIGEYTIEETKAPAGYDLNTTKEKITLSGTNTTIVKEFYNTPKPATYTLNVTKKDIDTKGELKGATLVIKQGDTVKKECVMTDTATCSLGGLSAGTYTISETKAPEGYTLSTEIKTITLSGANTTKNVDFYNTKKGLVKISKVDVTSQTELPGATLVVKDSNGKEIETWVSDDSVHYISLDPGKYTLSETLAPEGYDLNTTTITFEVKAGGVVTEVKMENKLTEIIIPEEPEPEEPQEEVVSVPSTGINTIITYILSGLAVVAGGLIIYKNRASNAKEK